MVGMRGLPEERRTRLEDLVAAGSVVSAASGRPVSRRAEEHAAGPVLPVLPVLPGLAGLLPEGGLRGGGVYAVEGSVLLGAALLAEASRSGRWGAVVGLPALGAEALAQLGARLDRLAVVPAPGRSWANVVGTLAEAVSVILAAAPAGIAPAEAGRVEARLRQQGCALVVQGGWPRPDARLRLARSEWLGIGAGHGHLGEHRVAVAAELRREAGRERFAELLLPEGTALAPVTAIGAVAS